MTEIPSDIMTKMERFCAYQERCENDVRRKLTSFHLSENQEDEIVRSLLEDGFLNEERYAEVFVRSKVKAAWGRQKIVSALRAKRIPNELIHRVWGTVSDEEYRETLRSVIGKWLRAHGETENTREKLVRHLLSKGYGLEDILREV